MKLKYERPKTEVNEFATVDVITTSGEPVTNPGDDNPTPFPCVSSVINSLKTKKGVQKTGIQSPLPFSPTHRWHI